MSGAAAAPAPGGGGGMSPADLAICKQAVDNLMSKTNSGKNYLFLEPVDLTLFPTYAEVVKRPMDLGTVRTNLTSGLYKTRDEFFADVNLVFENAFTFHGGIKESAWIIKLAKQMTKLVEKERKKAERKAAGAGSGAGIVTGGGKKKGGRRPSAGATGAGAASSAAAAASAGDSAGKKSGKPAVKLKLSAPAAVAAAIGASQQASAEAAAATAPAAPPAAAAAAKSQGKASKKNAKSKETVVKAKPSKPKLKLTLSLGGGGGSSGAAGSAAARSSSPPGGTAGSTGSASRGKQLPSDVKGGGKDGKTSPGGGGTTKAVPKPKLRLSISDATGGQGGGGKATTAGKGKKSKAAAKAPAKSKVAPAKAVAPAATAPAAAKAAGVPAPGAGAVARGGMAMTPSQVAQCSKVLSALRRRNPHDKTVWFLKPVSDPRLIDDYRAKIPYPADLGTIGKKLERGEYPDIASFVLDVRRVFANCLRYNTSIKDSFRPVARDMLSSAEEILALFVAKPAAPVEVYPRLLYCWKLGLSVLDTLLNMTNTSDGHQTAHYFLHPVSFFTGGEFPPDYLSKVKTPMDLGTISSRLFEGTYQSVTAFVADCRLVCENCTTYYSGREDGKLFTEQADRLYDLMSQQLGALVRYDASPAAAAAKMAPPVPIVIPKPSRAWLSSMLNELRQTKYTDKFTKLTESAAVPFEKPVNIALFPDYLQFVDTPMDFQAVERKIDSEAYETPEDFEYDVALIFRNCERYNVPRRNLHIVALAKHCAKTFRKMFSKRMSALLENGGVEPSVASSNSDAATKQKAKKRPSSTVPDDDEAVKPVKKIKLDLSSAPKPTPRISITAGKAASSASSPKSTGRRSKSPLPGAGAAGTKKKDAVAEPKKPDEPVPLHVAIAQIKESFPLRRPYKLLESWESACSRFFRELMRHPWISAARPKFIFHVPVPVLFPTIKEAYAAKIKHPMDLTSAEAKLLQGGIYMSPQEFVDDVALVFANAITFNRAGHEEGDAMSCAYFDVSKHLLRYTRWLSLEYLSSHLSDDDHSDPPTEEGLVTTWKLTRANKKLSREEMESIVLKAPLDLSEEGDKYTYMESECEKLLKSLRHQSDLKFMYFFIQPNYPPDYTAYISKPMDWERVNQTLQSRRYEKIGEVVDDLRLIFSNALKYNARGQGTETVSGRAYDSAVYMSDKLEAAIDKMLISVSNRLETEKIDRTIAERELEAEERAEEERLRKAWQKEREDAASGKVGAGTETRVETVERVKVIQRRLPQRKVMDFEFPFNDEDEGGQEQSHIDALRQQKLIFEKQRSDRVKMHKATTSVGADVFSGIAEQLKAIEWAKKKAAQKKLDATQTQGAISVQASRDSDTPKATLGASRIAEELSKKDRGQIKVKLQRHKKKRKKPKPSLLMFE